MQGLCLSRHRVYNDNIGNLMFEKNGEDGPTVLFAAHMDECGFIVTGIESHGYLTFNQLGGWFDQVLLGQRVVIMSKKGPLKGVIACKPPHLMELEEMKKVITKDKMFIDLGCANKDEAEECGLRLGDCVVPDSRFNWFTKTKFKDGKKSGKRTLAMGKAFDDRLGVCAVLDLIRSLKEGKIKHPNKVVAACTVQEEVGTRGAKTVANSVRPDVAIIVDVDIAGDVPGIDPILAPARMGDGPAITIWDGGMIPNQPLKELVFSVCEKRRSRTNYPMSKAEAPTAWLSTWPIPASDHCHRNSGSAHPLPCRDFRPQGPREFRQAVPRARKSDGSRNGRIVHKDMNAYDFPLQTADFHEFQYAQI